MHLEYMYQNEIRKVDLSAPFKKWADHMCLVIQGPNAWVGFGEFLEVEGVVQMFHVLSVVSEIGFVRVEKGVSVMGHAGVIPPFMRAPIPRLTVTGAFAFAPAVDIDESSALYSLIVNEYKHILSPSPIVAPKGPLVKL